MTAAQAPAHRVHPELAGGPLYALGRAQALWLVFALLVSLFAGSALQAAERTGTGGVLVIATGGTIANSPAGRLTGQQLVDALPPAARAHVRSAEAFANVASPTLDLGDWLRLTRRVTEAFAGRPALDGIVVTAGTDTLEELAWFLHLTVLDDRPVVLVGAMRRPRLPGADGVRNLADAIAVAGASSMRGLGTLVVMRGRVSLARDVRKRHSTRLDAFDPDPDALLATVHGTRVAVAHRPRADRLRGALPVGPGVTLPRVDVLLVYQGASADLIDYAVRQGARGLVIAAAGAGSLTPSQADAVRRLAGQGVPIVIATRTGAGPVESFDPADPAVMGANGQPPLKARITLMLGLARKMDVQALEMLFGGD